MTDLFACHTLQTQQEKHFEVTKSVHFFPRMSVSEMSAVVSLSPQLPNLLLRCSATNKTKEDLIFKATFEYENLQKFFFKKQIP